MELREIRSEVTIHREAAEARSQKTPGKDKHAGQKTDVDKAERADLTLKPSQQRHYT